MYFLTKKNVLTFLFCLFNLCELNNGSLEQVQDDELLNLIKAEKYVVVLFSRKYCELCDRYDNELSNLREDLVESLNAWVVQTVDSQMVRLYTPNKEPAIVFFRHGVPLLYDGPLNDELIYHTLTSNKDPLVMELTDDTFEHLTQAATGATTGDWFVMFYSSDCIDCQRLQARWEAVAAHLKTRMNIARVNRGGAGAITARRFNVFHVPHFIFFRHGKMYYYNSQKHDVASFVSFAEEGYKDLKPEIVPPPKSALSDLIALVYDYYHQFRWHHILLLSIFLCGFAASLLYLLMPASQPGKRDHPKKRKEKKENKN